MDQVRIIQPEVQAEDRHLDLTLRPKRLVEYIGQTKVKENLIIFIEAAKKRGEPLEHLLIYGPPGLGKTTLANIIANETKGNIRQTSGPALERTGDLASILTNLENGDILFIDEIHRLSRVVEEVLYPAMEDYSLDLIIGKGPSARTLRLDLPHFTLIGATTRIGAISSPLRDRFGAIHHLDYYQDEDMKKIVERSAKILNIPIEDKAVEMIANRSRSTPRVANRLLKRVRDFCQVKADGQILFPIAQEALAMLEVDPLGLDRLDRKILEIIITKFSGGPVGIETIAAATSEERETIEDVYEPYLIQRGLLNRTSKGRLATPAAFKHLGLFKKNPDREKLPLKIIDYPLKEDA
jgi:Holliday junction DNA helicase RuvB